MVEVLRVENAVPYSFLAFALVLFLVIYGSRRLKAVTLMAVLLLVLYFDFGEDPELTGCEKKTTSEVCDYYRSSGNCEGLESVFERDDEWAKFRFAVSQGLPASKSRLLNGYSTDFFPDCQEQVDSIKEKIDNYDGKSDFPGTVNTFETLLNPLVFLVLGFAGFFFSCVTIGYRFFK